MIDRVYLGGKLNIYIGGSFSARARIRVEGDLLGKFQNVLSHWYKDEYFVEKAWDNDFSGLVAENMASLDAYQILTADLLVIDTLDKSSTGGSDSELGIGLGLRLGGRPIQIAHIGPYRNVFQALVKDEHYTCWEEFRERNQNLYR